PGAVNEVGEGVRGEEAGTANAGTHGRRAPPRTEPLVAPDPEGAVRFECEREIGPGGHGHDVGDLDRGGDRTCTASIATAQLREAVVSPAPHRSVPPQREGAVVTPGDGPHPGGRAHPRDHSAPSPPSP